MMGIFQSPEPIPLLETSISTQSNSTSSLKPSMTTGYDMKSLRSQVEYLFTVNYLTYIIVIPIELN